MSTTRFGMILACLAVLASGTALAADHGYVTGIRADQPADKVFRVDIEKINGDEPGPSPNVRVPAGKNSITVSLVFNSLWGKDMQYTQQQVYQKDFVLDVEPGKTYFIGAVVDTAAGEDAQKDGSFWGPVIVKTE